MYLLCRYASHRCIGVFDSLEAFDSLLPKSVNASNFLESGEPFLYRGALCFITECQCNIVFD